MASKRKGPEDIKVKRRLKEASKRRKRNAQKKI